MHRDAGTIAKRYALALFQCLDSEKQKTEALVSAENFEKVLQPEIEAHLARPVVSAASKNSLIKDIARELHLPTSFSRTLTLMWENGRLSVLRLFLRRLIELLDEDLKIARIDYSSAQPISDEERTALKSEFEKSLGKTVRMTFSVNEKLLAGCVVRVGFRVIDMSLRTRIGSIKEALSQGV